MIPAVMIRACMWISCDNGSSRKEVSCVLFPLQSQPRLLPSCVRRALRHRTSSPDDGVFASRCAACHGTEGGGGELGPSIVARIPLRTDADLEAVIREGLPGAGMPSFANLTKTESADLIAFLRTLRPRTGTGSQRASVTLADGSSLSGLVMNQSAGEMQLLSDDRRTHLLRETTSGRYREVTSQTGWTTYNGHASGNRYSALTQITAGNVSRLVPQWVFTLPNLSQGQVTPVVVDGVMYVSAANDLYALDAGSGRQVWNYRRPRTRGLAGVAARGVNRGVARQRRAGLHDDRPRASHRAQSCQRRAPVGDGDG